MITKVKNKIFGRKARALALVFALSFVMSGSLLTMCGSRKEAQALCTPCVACLILDTAAAAVVISLLEEQFWSPTIEKDIENHINSELNWIVTKYFKDYVFQVIAEMTEYLSAFGMLQVQIIGTFFDAQNQLETQRLFFKLHAEASKDYHPSDDFCWFGTTTRSLAATDNRARINLIALSQSSLARQLGTKGTSSAGSKGDDKKQRWERFVTTYCDPKDNNWIEIGTGLDLACDHDGSNGSAVDIGAVDLARVNRDINYTALLEEPRTLEANFVDKSSSGDNVITDDEQDIMAMSANLYGDGVPTRQLSNELFKGQGTTLQAQKLYIDLRAVVAKRNVALNSFNSLVAMKSEGSNGDPSSDPDDKPNAGRYIGAIIKELMPSSATNDEIIQIMGENPSYYAQLETLGKKIYQNPDFFANLYDKPANVKRKSVAMKAIELMLDRALLESELRQEMLLSVMLSNELSLEFRSNEKASSIGGQSIQDATIIDADIIGDL